QAAIREAGGVMLITADHGNAETMRDAASDQPHTAHTLNPVPFLIAGQAPGIARLSNGRLADIAPTILDLMGLAKPVEMTGRSLILHEDEKRAAS
ncbi:MAG: 2,3-bisphosphoglycerate-independent phosphoglycerate mutase, partial [Alphaproteobacteria bacterium]